MVLLVGAGLASLTLLLSLGGCSDRNTAGAEVREVRLTRDIGWNGRPFLDASGREVVFSNQPLDQEGTFRICTVPADGGEVRTLTPDSLSLVAIANTPDGKSFIALSLTDSRVREVSRSGQTLRLFDEIPLTRLFDVSPDGREFFYAKFTGDNNDVGIFDLDTGRFELLGETANWEVDGCFGPGPEGLTVVSRESYGNMEGRLEVRRSAEDSEFTPLPLEPAVYKTPRWSADGRFLAFASDRFGSLDLWVLDDQTREVIQLTSGPEDDVFPSWSADGRLMAFSRRTSTSHIFVGDPTTLEATRVTGGDARDTSPVGSHDGKWVAFVRTPSLEGGKGDTAPDLCVMTAEGEELHQLGVQGLSSMQENAISWSPDNMQIAFSADDGSGDADIFRISRDGGKAVRVTIDPGEDIFPAWSPDGEYIGYTRPAGGETHVWAIPATGGVPIQLSFGPGVNQGLVWAPDSRTYAYLSLGESGAYELRMAHLDSPRDVTRVLVSESPMIPFAWSQDGRTILAWSRGEEMYIVSAVPLDGSPVYEVGRPAGSGGEERGFLRFTARGERFSGVLHPGGIRVFAHGDNVSDIFVLKVGELLDRAFKAQVRGEAS